MVLMPEKQNRLIPPQQWPAVRVVVLPIISHAEALACGEAVLERVTDPVLMFAPHVTEPYLSIGFNQKAAEVPVGAPFVRRPTGGGLIDIRGTFHLASIVPQNHLMWNTPREPMYLEFSHAIVSALNLLNIPSDIALDAPEYQRGEDGSLGRCFDHLSRFDLHQGEQKIAASSVFRTLRGQIRIAQIRIGSLDSEAACRTLTQFLTPLHAREARSSELTERERLVAAQLLEEKYLNPAWNQRI